MRRIMLVDDEVSILRALKRVFMESDYEVYIAENGPAALALLEQQPVDLIISDMRMPEMTGHQLLMKIKRKYPQILRIILSGYADEEIIFRALLDGSAKLYMFKPWDNDRLLETVEHMLKMRELFQGKKLFELVNSIENLAMVGQTYMRVTELIEVDAGINDIAAEIEEDPEMAARVLMVANAAFTGVNTGSVKQAVIYLGLAVVKELLLSVAVMEEMPSRMGGMERATFWKHAVYSNRIVERIYSWKLGKKLPDSFACAGLIYDVGTIFLIRHFSEAYEKVLLKMLEDKSLTRSQIEQEIIGISHGELGGYLLDWWGLPFPMIETALFHHNPKAAAVSNWEIVCAVHVADWAAWKLVGRDPGWDVDPWALEHLALSREECEELVKQMS